MGRYNIGRLGVYPRTYGGTRSSDPKIVTVMGLSPHIRGNAYLAPDFENGVGSIPAHTGERLQKRDVCVSTWVYPRTYGGTPPN